MSSTYTVKTKDFDYLNQYTCMFVNCEEHIIYELNNNMITKWNNVGRLMNGKC